MKRCVMCGIEKNKNEFGKDKSQKDGLRFYCHICANIVRKKSYIKNKNKILLKNKEHRENNKEYYRNYNKKYRENNKEYYQSYGREYRENPKNKNRICLRCNIEQEISQFTKQGKICFTCKYTTEKTCNKCNETKPLSEFKNDCKICKDCKTKANSNRKFANICRIRLNKALKRQNGKKAFKSIELLSCDMQTARNHIESQFTENLSWESDIHIDHIIPCSIYDLTKESEQLKCFNYKNLRPCLQKENNIKKNKLDYILIEKHNIWHLLPEKLQKNNY